MACFVTVLRCILKVDKSQCNVKPSYRRTVYEEEHYINRAVIWIRSWSLELYTLCDRKSI